MAKKMYTEALKKVQEETSRRNIDLLEEAIKAGDTEKALELHKLNVMKKKGWHDFSVRWVNLKNFKKYAPDEAIFECMEDYAQWCYPPCLHDWMKKFKAGEATFDDFPAEEFLENRATLWQALHDNGDQIWEEDEEKITFTLQHCNSGGFLVSDSYYKVIWQGFQCYCLNCTTMWEFGWYKWFGWPLFIMDVPKIGSDGKCVMVMYKDPKDIPDSYYERTGLERKI